MGQVEGAVRMREVEQPLVSAGRVGADPVGGAVAPRRGHSMRSLVLDIVAPIALFYGVRGAGGSLWLALMAGGVLPVITTAADLVTRRRADLIGLLMLAALAVSAARRWSAAARGHCSPATAWSPPAGPGICT